MPYSETVKKCVYRWRENNPEKYQETNRKYVNKFYANNKAKYAAKYHLKREFLRLAGMYFEPSPEL